MKDCNLFAIFNVTMSGTANIKSENAQMTLDYVTGVGIFLLAVAFVFQFMYTLFVPFLSGTEDISLAGERVSTTLVDRVLAADKAGAMSVIDQGKLYSFNTKLSQNYTDELIELGLFSNESLFDLNVSVSRINGSLMNQSGSAIPDNINIASNKRLVLIVNSSTGYNETAIISMRVW
ncbi:Uncharacterised protein [uncultured archaeon]|nr:Uncharacterised protein [uncultured archaeon]